MRALFSLLAIVLVLFGLEASVLLRAWSLHRSGQLDAEIAWLESVRGWVPWEAGIGPRIDRLYRERVRQELDREHLTAALDAFRVARRRELGLGRPFDRELMALGIESYARTADYVEKLGRLSRAADWDDSVFVLAVRGAEPHQRYAATAAFMEGLDLRVRDGKPCAALGRVAWARRGLGGDVPGLPETVEPDLRRKCGVRGTEGR